MKADEIAYFVAQTADDKNARDIMILEMGSMSVMADYFVICHGNSEKQVQAIARAVKEETNKNELPLKRMEGFSNARWVLVDLESVIVHIFHKEDREYYQLEKLWGDAPVLTLEGHHY